MPAEVYYSFGEYLARFMDARGFSGASLSERLGEKSATLISRIKADQCSPARCEAFLQQLTDALGDLTPQELALFRRGIVILKVGHETYHAYRAAHQIFTGEKVQAVTHGSLAKMLIPAAPCDSYEIICMQCADPVATDALVELCRDYSGPLSIRHYITFPTPTPSARIIASLMPILCDARYSLTELRFEGGAPSLGLTAQNFIFTRRTSGSRTEYRLLLPCPDGSALQLIPGSEPGYRRGEEFLRDLDCEQLPLNNTVRLSGPMDVIAFLSGIVDAERGRAICMLRRDFCFSFFPLDVLQSAFNDMLLQLPEQYTYFVTELRRLCFMRHRAMSTTARPVRALLSAAGIERFLQTGRLTDHFFGLRPFTVEERRQVLLHVVRMVTANPNISIHISRDESIFHEHDIFIFEKHKVLITPSHTDYQRADDLPGSGYKEVSLTEPQLVDQLSGYFTEWLLPGYALSRAETLAWLTRKAEGMEKL